LAPGAIGALAALLEAGAEPVRLASRYERTALAGGEFWRLLSAHLVHLGPSHMVMNVVALGVLALIFASLLRALDWFGVAVLAALAIDAGLYWLEPAVDWYVGLSGVLHGFWAAACVYAWSLRRAEALPITALMVIKLGFESWVGPVPLTGSIAAGPVVTAAHLYGAIGGIAWSAGMLVVRRCRGRPL
jgi:rhomboid family GlyGly-CTERM serine protease